VSTPASSSPSAPQPPPPSSYRFAPAVLLRSFGLLLVTLGVLLALLGLLVAFAGVPRGILTGAVVVAVVLVVAAAALAGRRATLVEFGEEGYRVRLLRGAGVRQARWREVEDAVTATVAGHDCVVLRLRDGGTTTIPVKVLDVDVTTFMQDLSARLDRGHGYRRLR
jgi:hypothetical protein